MSIELDLGKLRAEASKKNLMFRSCWNCNPAHKHLKKAEYPFICFECGHYYYKGVDITDIDKINAKKDEERRERVRDIMNHWDKIKNINNRYWISVDITEEQ